MRSKWFSYIDVSWVQPTAKNASSLKDFITPPVQDYRRCLSFGCLPGDGENVTQQSDALKWAVRR